MKWATIAYLTRLKRASGRPLVKVTIKAGLEKRLQKYMEFGGDARDLVSEVLGAINDAREKAEKAKSRGGLPYKELVALFSREVDLILPPNPSVGWIIRQTARAKDIGLDADGIRQVCAGARLLYKRDNFELDFLLRAAPRLVHAVQSNADRSGEPVQTGLSAEVRTGREKL
jgi:hypothetical protein